MQRENPDDKEILNHIDSSVTQLDEQRLQELNNLRQLQEIKNEVYKLERSRLVNKYGEDHPRVQKADLRLSYNKKMIPGLDKEIERAKTKNEPLPNNAWRVHGRVFNKPSDPALGVTVYLSDEKKNWIRELGNTCTNEAGYYSLTVDEKLIGRVEKRPLFLSVSDKSQQKLYQDPDPLFAFKGLIDYRDVYLNVESCVTPPAARDDEKENKPGANQENEDDNK